MSMIDDKSGCGLIDTVLLKASYDLYSEEDGLAYSIRKLADDVRRGRELTTLKLTRFIDDRDGCCSSGYDYLKFNFPVCGNLSSADLLVVYSALNGFNTFVVGNAERSERDAVIVNTLGLKNVLSVPELDFDARHAPESASRELSFVNTQKRGYAAIPSKGLILEMAADQPLLFNTFRHALDLSYEDTHFAINLNAVTLMKKLVPEFIRNGYDKVTNSLGREVIIKENNNFAQDKLSVKANAPVFGTVYARRNGGNYFSAEELLKIVGVKGLFRRIVHLGKLVPHTPNLVRYFKQRKTLDKAVSYKAMNAFLNAMLSPYWLKDSVRVDATNDDIFSCWDMDGLNNDYLGYKTIFDRNFDNLKALMPYAEEIYKVHDALGKAELGQKEFAKHYDNLRQKILARLTPESMHELGIEDDIADKVRDICTAMFEDIKIDHLAGIEQHAKVAYRKQFEQHREEYVRVAAETIR